VLRKVVAGKATKGIWCEKPLAVSIRQAEDMMSQCKNAQIRLLVNYQRRYDPFYQSIKTRLSELVGDVQVVSAYYSGGITTNGSHLIDLLDYLLGPCQIVDAKPAGSEGEDGELISSMIFGKTHVLMFPCDNSRYSILDLNIIGSQARLDTVDKPFWRHDYRYFIKEKDRIAGSSFVGTIGKDVLIKSSDKRVLDRALADLVSSISDRREPLCGGAEGLRAVSVVAAMSYSAQRRCPVTMPFGQKDLIIPRPGGDVRRWKS
jgi:predicted dehydrogenase